MPIYEFKCPKCGAKFDKLCRIEWEGTVSCPACGDPNPARLLSTFSSPGTGGGSDCSGCSSKNCGSCK